MKPVKRLDRQGLIALVSSMWKVGNTTEEEDEYNLFMFAANCPDPPAAMDLLLEADQKDLSAEAMVDKALAMPKRPVSEYSAKELHPNNPLRRILFE